MPLDLSTRRSRERVQLDTKQHRISDKGRGQQDGSSPGWLTPRSKKEKSKDLAPRNVSRVVSAPSAVGRSPGLCGSGEQRLSPGKEPVQKSGNILL